MAEAKAEELSAEDRAVSRIGYVGKVETLALLLLGGVKPKSLKIWYGVSDSELSEAQEKIKALKGGD